MLLRAMVQLMAEYEHQYVVPESSATNSSTTISATTVVTSLALSMASKRIMIGGGISSTHRSGRTGSVVTKVVAFFSFFLSFFHLSSISLELKISLCGSFLVNKHFFQLYHHSFTGVTIPLCSVSVARPFLGYCCFRSNEFLPSPWLLN